MTDIAGDELWGDYTWEDPTDSGVINLDANVAPQVAQKVKSQESIKRIKRTATLAALGATGMALLALIPHRHNQTPTFAATKVDGCYVSDNWKWVYPRNGLDDLVIHNIQGVTSENGKGSKCLEAAKLVIADWANHDNIPQNNIDLDVMNQYDSPTIVWGAPYAVPYFATTKPQG